VAEADRRYGATGPPRLARLLAELGERGLLAGVAGADAGPAPVGRLRRLFTPRDKVIPGLGRVFEAVYRRGGWLLFTRPGLWALGVLAVAGIAVFGYLLGGRYGTPFVVAQKIGIGGLVFLGGRFAVVAVHELAHGLAMASLGRRVERAGFKVLVVLPFAFVDTSEAWFEPRRRRIGVSAAGPVSDLALGAVFSICSLAFAGTVREVFFQLAFAAYVGAFFNLNPFLERDGYHILVDVLREPGLRRRAKAQLSRRLSGQGRRESDSPVLARYAVWGLVWSAAAAGFAIFFTLRFLPIMKQFAPDAVVWVVLGTLWLVFFVPVFVVIGKPLLDRVRGVQPAGR
jgi:putative peptide zinc metalloprotease protein